MLAVKRNREVLLDIIRGLLALTILVEGGILLYRGSDGVVASLMIAVIGFYFGAEIARRLR